MVVRAIRKEDPDVVGEITWWMPLPIYVAGQMIREFRTRGKYKGLWRVEVSERRGFAAAVPLGEYVKADALDLVDAKAAEITLGSPK